LVTAGLITFMTDQSFLWNQSIGGAGGYAFQNFIGVAALGVWVIGATPGTTQSQGNGTLA
jgi:hypothetical protein